MFKIITSLVSFLFLLAGCSGISTKTEDNQPYFNGLPVTEIFYDNIEEPIGYGKYGAFLFFLPNNQFVILRNRESAEYFISNLSTFESKYPSTKDPVKYSKDGNKIGGLNFEVQHPLMYP